MSIASSIAMSATSASLATGAIDRLRGGRARHGQPGRANALLARTGNRLRTRHRRHVLRADDVRMRACAVSTRRSGPCLVRDRPGATAGREHPALPGVCRLWRDVGVPPRGPRRRSRGEAMLLHGALRGRDRVHARRTSDRRTAQPLDLLRAGARLCRRDDSLPGASWNLGAAARRRSLARAARWRGSR